jgi:hypothetical protein
VRSLPTGAAAILVAAGVALAGCGGAKVTAAKRATAATVVDVVERNMMASEAGDARSYCASYTTRYLRARFHGGAAACAAKFRGAPASVRDSNEPRFLGAVLDAEDDTLAEVHYKLGKVRGLDYVLRLTAVPGGKKRWLIDDRVVPVE